MKQPTLYILMRDDLVSMNAGKAIAQGSHAANDFEYVLNNTDRDHSNCGDFIDAVEDWREDRTFGLCYTLACKPSQWEIIMSMLDDGGTWQGDVIHDPTYPVNDGEVTHYIPLDTCAWVFAWPSENKMDKAVEKELRKLELFP